MSRINNVTSLSEKHIKCFPFNKQCLLQRVKIRFITIDLEKESYCQYDYVKISEAGRTKVFCGNKKPADYVTSRNYAYVYFKTDGSVTRGGFLAVYTAVDPSLCKSIDYGWHIMAY